MVDTADSDQKHATFIPNISRPAPHRRHRHVKRSYDQDPVHVWHGSKSNEKDEKILENTVYPVQTALEILRCVVEATRLDLACIGNLLARCAQKPTHRHWIGLKQIAQYIYILTSWLVKSTHHKRIESIDRFSLCDSFIYTIIENGRSHLCGRFFRIAVYNTFQNHKYQHK